MSEHTFDTNIKAKTAKNGAAKIQHDHANVPEWAVVVPERKVKVMQARVYPSMKSLQAGEARADLTHAGVNVHPRAVRICELDAHDRKGRLSVARIVIRVVIGQKLRFHDRHIRITRLDPVHYGFGGESVATYL